MLEVTSNILSLKKLGAKVTGLPVEKVTGSTIAEILCFIERNYTGGTGGSGQTITIDSELLANSENPVQNKVLYELFNGNEEESYPKFTWQIGRMDDGKGEFTADTQNMRICSDKIYLTKNSVINFSKATTYPYVITLCHPVTGEFISNSSSWTTESSYTLDGDYYIAITARDITYRLFTVQARFDEFVASISIDTDYRVGDIGIYNRLTNVEVKAITNEVSLVELTNKTNALEVGLDSVSAITPIMVTLTDEQNTELSTTLETLNTLYNNPNIARICFITDLHITVKDDEEFIRKWSNKINGGLTYYNKICEALPFDFTLYGGDYLNNSNQTTKTMAQTAYKVLLDYIANGTNQKIPYALLKGNHDDNTMYTDHINGMLNDTELYNALLGCGVNHSVRDVDHLDKFYGYYDIPNKKIRVIFLNTVDIPQVLDEENNTVNYKGQWITGFSEAQLKFIVKALTFNDEGWHVLFMSHHPLYYNGQNGNPYENNGKGVMEIIEAFANNSSGSYVSTTTDFEATVPYDFTSNKSNTVIACLSGHIHDFKAETFNNINYVTCETVYGVDADSSHNTSINCLAIDRVNKTLDIVVCGYGTDATINY